jgi:hypothetical protein
MVVWLSAEFSQYPVCPVGKYENSPAFQRRVMPRKKDAPCKGRLNHEVSRRVSIVPMARDSGLEI